jgi:hypothetical protein
MFMSSCITTWMISQHIEKSLCSGINWFDPGRIELPTAYNREGARDAKRPRYFFRAADVTIFSKPGNPFWDTDSTRPP